MQAVRRWAQQLLVVGTDSPDVTAWRWEARRVRVAACLVALALLGYAVVLLADPFPRAATVAVDDVGQLLAAASAAVCCVVAACGAPAGRIRRAWLLLAAGTGAWAAGEGVWSYYEVLAGRAAPFPSLADVGFLAFPVLASAALLVLPAGGDLPVSRARDLLDGLIIAGSLLVLTWATSLGAVLDAGGPTRLSVALGLAYPLGDVVVITLVLLVIGRATADRRGVLALVAVGLVALAGADSAFVYLTSTASYASGTVSDLGWVAGFALVALAGVLAATPAPPASAGQARVPSWRRLGLPYLPLLLAATVVAGQLLAGRGPPPGPQIMLGLGLIAVVLGRQFLTLADNRRLLVELRAEREHARHLALHDPLTGLPNRALFYDRVAHALSLRSRDATAASGAATTSVMFCDLDDFKTVNDRLGHATGDALLVAVAGRLRASLRPADTVARLGGDEFAVLIEQPVEPPPQVAARLVDAMTAPLILAGTELAVSISISIGLATAIPVAEEALDADALLQRADAAMYAAKRQGKATWVIHDPRPHGNDNRITLARHQNRPTPLGHAARPAPLGRSPNQTGAAAGSRGLAPDR